MPCASRWFLSDKKVIAGDKLTHGDHEIRLSTVFLVLDHYFGTDETAPPVLFETMLFGADDDANQLRYETIEQAVRGHNLILEKLRAAKPLMQIERVRNYES